MGNLTLNNYIEGLKAERAKLEEAINQGSLSNSDLATHLSRSSGLARAIYLLQTGRKFLRKQMFKEMSWFGVSGSNPTGADGDDFDRHTSVAVQFWDFFSSSSHGLEYLCEEQGLSDNPAMEYEHVEVIKAFFLEAFESVMQCGGDYAVFFYMKEGRWYLQEHENNPLDSL